MTSSLRHDLGPAHKAAFLRPIPLAGAMIFSLALSGCGVVPTEARVAVTLTSNLLTSPGGIGIDGSGNVWLTGLDYWATGAASFVTEVLGIAAPVTPKSLAVMNNAIANEP